MKETNNFLNEKELEKVQEIMQDVRIAYGVNPDYVIMSQNSAITFKRISKINEVKPIKFICLGNNIIAFCFGRHFPKMDSYKSHCEKGMSYTQEKKWTK